MLTNQTSSGSVASQTSQTLSETSANSESENSVSIKSEDKDQMAALFSAIPSVSEFCTQLFQISADNSSIESMVAYNEAYHMIISQIPSEVEIVLDIIARTGILPYPWPLLKSAIGFRILQLCYLSVKKRGFAPSESMPTPFVMRVYTIICWCVSLPLFLSYYTVTTIILLTSLSLLPLPISYNFTTNYLHVIPGGMLLRTMHLLHCNDSASY